MNKKVLSGVTAAPFTATMPSAKPATGRKPLRRAAFKTAAAVATGSLLLAGAGVVHADIIKHQDTVETVAKVMPLNAGGPVGTTTLVVVKENGDGKNGCNIQGTAESLKLSIVSSNASVATVSPSSVTFNACGDQQTLTVTPVSAGDANITVTEVSNNTGATFNLAPAAFSVKVASAAPANTAPTLEITGTTAGASYNKGAVPASVCKIADAEDGPSTKPATLSAITGPDAATGIGSQTASCSYTDAGGLTVASDVTYTIADPTPPVITHTLAPAPDGNAGWHKSQAALTWTVSEPDSPSTLARQGCENVTVTADQAEQSYTCSATSGGGSAGPATVSIKKDGTAPTVGFSSPVTTGYFGSIAAEPTCTATDNLSGVASCTITGYSKAVGTHNLTATATDVAGNTATKTETYTVHPWEAKGFYQPVDMNGVFNSVKGGSTVPVKFEVFAGTTEIIDPSQVALKAATVACSTSAPIDEIEVLAAGSTSLRYDATSGQFIYNWKTPVGAGTCYKLTMTAADGSALGALFKMK